MPEFKRADGTLSRYALACGYIQKFYAKRGLATAEVTAESSTCYSVRRFDANGRRTHWETEPTLRRAYALARKLAKGN